MILDTVLFGSNRRNLHLRASWISFTRRRFGTEHSRYKGELNTILNYHAEAPEIREEVQQLLRNFQVEKKSKEVNSFWDLQVKQQNIHMNLKLVEKRRELLEKEQEGSTRWVVNDIDITEICREYRAIVVKKCESMEVTLSATEELILSHVFVFQEQSSLGLCEHFDDELWAELFVCGLYPAPIPDKISNLFLNIVKIPCEEPNQTERQKLARRYLRNFEVITEEEEIIIEMFRELVDNEQSSFTRNYVVENTHIIRNIAPIILKPFFRNNKRITFEGAESSAIAKRRFDPERLGTKPDFTVVELFIVEIKPNKTNNALVSEDLVSLGKTMKCAIDKSIKDGVWHAGYWVLGKSLCDGPPVRRDLPHDINWRVRASKGFHIMGYCLAVLSSPEHNSSYSQ